METKAPGYGKTVIDHNIRMKLGLSTDEYCVMDFLSMFLKSEKYINYGYIQEHLGLREAYIYNILQRLLSEEFLINTDTKAIVADKWIKHFPKDSTVSEVISHLNKIAGTSYKEDGKQAIKYINARIKEGFVLQDFFTVIESKYNEWGSDSGMKQYLRPETLFGTKMESYLVHAKQNKPITAIRPGMSGMVM